MPNWGQCFNILILLSIVGFALTIISGFWNVLTVLLFIGIAIIVIRFAFRR